MTDGVISNDRPSCIDVKCNKSTRQHRRRAV